MFFKKNKMDMDHPSEKDLDKIEIEAERIAETIVKDMRMVLQDDCGEHLEVALYDA